MTNSLNEQLMQRLNVLPGRISKPLINLYEVGHLDSMVLTTVLDAGELAGDTSRLLAFATSYLFLKQQGVPIGDVIAMSKAFNRRINLWWSAKRWAAEHDRLSRLGALRTLSAENVTYDVAEFAQLLPTVFCGYLIKSSRRLGMEGLRQRHCVASWHSRLQAKSCAIVSLFAHRKRWTVELFQTGNPDYPLTIGQIKTRFNENPSSDIRRQIYGALEISLQSSSTLLPGSVCARDERVYKENIMRLIPTLRDLGVRKINAFFSGSGDSGQIETVQVVPQEASEAFVTIIDMERSFEQGAWVLTRRDRESRLDDAITEILYDYLEDTGVDWYNNDGGQGEFLLDFEQDILSMFVDQNYTNTTTEFSAEYSFDEFIEGINDGIAETRGKYLYLHQAA